MKRYLYAAAAAVCAFAFAFSACNKKEEKVPARKVIIDGVEIPTKAPEPSEAEESEPEFSVESAEPTPKPTPKPTPVPTPTPIPTPTPAPTPTPYYGAFGKNFEGQQLFNEDGSVYQDEWNYRSDKVSISVTMHHEDELTYFFADIYVKDIEYIRTAFSNGKYNRKRQPVAEMAEDNNALVAVNGDYYTAQEVGLIIRNGELYRSTASDRDVCVLYKDGSMVGYPAGKWDKEEIMEKDPWQSWTFGPMLVHEGVIPEKFNTNVRKANPRTAIGYIEPGHYCLLEVDGRQGSYSKGLDMESLAKLMSDLGCKEAFNLDGGATSVFWLFGEQISKQSDSSRGCSDIVYVPAELPVPEPEETEDE